MMNRTTRVGERMLWSKFRFQGLVGILVVLIAWSSDRSYAEAPSDDMLIPTADWMIPTITGLDFAKVSFVVSAPREFQDRLQERAEKQLEAELGPRDMNAEPVATLTLDLDCRPEVIAGHGILQCRREFRLEERVIPVRNVNKPPGRRPQPWATTWLYYVPMPDIRESISIEELEAEADKFIEQFIIAYKLGRWWEKKWEKESNANQKDEAAGAGPAPPEARRGSGRSP